MTLEGTGSIVITADNTASYIDSIATYKVSRNAKGPEMSKMVHVRGPFVTLNLIPFGTFYQNIIILVNTSKMYMPSCSIAIANTHVHIINHGYHPCDYNKV